jgi:hypothetical protein
MDEYLVSLLLSSQLLFAEQLLMRFWSLSFRQKQKQQSLIRTLLSNESPHVHNIVAQHQIVWHFHGIDTLLWVQLQRLHTTPSGELREKQVQHDFARDSLLPQKSQLYASHVN